jgi:hypothetical protein
VTESRAGPGQDQVEIGTKRFLRKFLKLFREALENR